MRTILKRPIVTEKMTNLQDQRQYAFEVDLKANKVEIAKTVEKKFNVTVESVRTMRCRGKQKEQLTRRGRFSGWRANWKKAVVTLKKDDKIDFVGGV
jgi:large subunit ribosomal protein L23